MEDLDELGGILTGGLLGNPILGYFNLGFFEIEVIEDPTQPGMRGMGAAGWRPNFGFKPRHKERQLEEPAKYVVITLSFQGNVTQKRYLVTDGLARISINILNTFNRVKEGAISIKRIFIRERKEIKPIVRITNDRD